MIKWFRIGSFDGAERILKVLIRQFASRGDIQRCRSKGSLISVISREIVVTTDEYDGIYQMKISKKKSRTIIIRQTIKTKNKKTKKQMIGIGDQAVALRLTKDSDGIVSFFGMNLITSIKRIVIHFEIKGTAISIIFLPDKPKNKDEEPYQIFLECVGEKKVIEEIIDKVFKESAVEKELVATYWVAIPSDLHEKGVNEEYIKWFRDKLDTLISDFATRKSKESNQGGS